MKNDLFETLSYVKKFSGTRLLVKLGGSALDEPDLIKSLCADLSLLHACGIEPIIVHGGGKTINQNLASQNLDSNFINGLRVTTHKIMDTIEATLCGNINTSLVRSLNAFGVRAVGLSGCDDNLLQCQILSEEYGLVGNIEQVNTSILEHLLQQNTAGKIIPVISPIGVDRNGQALNINADWAASCLATALNIDKLIYLSDQDGILDRQGVLLPQLDASELDHLIHTQVVVGGMLTKSRTILHALNHGINNIHIINAKRPHALLEELFTGKGIGTLCTRRASLKPNTLFT